MLLLLYIALGIIILKLYLKLTTGWCKSQTCLIGKTTLVTGANTGVGYETALDFAKRGARVILACRDEKRAEEACSRIIEETGNDNIVVRIIDMSSFNSVRAFAKKINETEHRLDILVNNAGIGIISDQRTEDGRQLVMQVNYFSSFLLTHLLIGLMRKTGTCRIINVSSLMAKFAYRFNLDKLDDCPIPEALYSYSKLCNILFTMELARRLEKTTITTYSLHPGAVATEIFRYVDGFTKLTIEVLKMLFLKTSEEGAQTTIFCSVQKGIEIYNGEHFEDCKRITPYRTAVRDPELPRKLWELTKSIVQLKPEEDLIYEGVEK